MFIMGVYVGEETAFHTQKDFVLILKKRVY